MYLRRIKNVLVRLKLYKLNVMYLSRIKNVKVSFNLLFDWGEIRLSNSSGC